MTLPNPFKGFLKCWSSSFRLGSGVSRIDFWSFQLIDTLLFFVWMVACQTAPNPISIIGGLYVFASVWINISSTIRRIKDTGKDPVNFCWIFVPFGGFYVTYLMFQSTGKYNAIESSKDAS